MKDILDVTNGCVVYQEQVMQIFRVLAGYSYGRADVVRRYMSKKKVKEMEKEKEYFLYGKKRDDGSVECEGAIARGVSKENALKIYDEMSEFAKYAFNKSHACAYSVVAYRTAYLKCHYPREYLSALITSVLDSEGKVASYIAEVGKQGIRVLPPSVNDSGIDFTVEGKDVRFGLLAIKNIGKNVLSRILEEREKNGKYKSFEDFLSRTCDFDVYEKVVENLIKSGAFDCFGKKRSQLLQVYSAAMKSLSKQRSSDVKGQIDLFSQLSGEETPGKLVIDWPDVEELPYNELLTMEKEVAGLYFSGHPLADYSAYAAQIGAASAEAVCGSFGDEGTGAYADGQRVTLVGMLKSCKTKTTKNGARMMFADCEDITGEIELIVFPKVLEQYADLLQNGTVAAFSGRISVKESRAGSDGETVEEAKLLLDNVAPVYKNGSVELETLLANAKATEKTEKAPAKETNPNAPYVPRSASPRADVSLYLRVPDEDAPVLAKVLNLCEIFRGGPVPVFILFEKTGKLTKLNYNVSINPSFLSLHKRYLGDANVVLKEKK